MTFWRKSSLLIPNVFRLARLIEDDYEHLLEHQDLSKKELLVLSNGQKAKVVSDDASIEGSDLEEARTPTVRKYRSPATIGLKKKVKRTTESIMHAFDTFN